MVFQLVVSVCSIFVLLKAWKSYRKKNVRFTTFILWAVLWIGMIFVVWQPQLTDRVAGFLQVGRGADAVLYLSLLVIFYLFFRIFVALERVDQQLTTVVRELAIIDKKSKRPL